MALAMLSYSWCDRKGFYNFNGLQCKNDRYFNAQYDNDHITAQNRS